MRRTETSGHFYYRMPKLKDRDKEGFSRLHPFGVLAMKVATHEGVFGVRVASALCHPNDEFRKASGRSAAYGKLNSEKGSIFIPKGSDISLTKVLSTLHPAHKPNFNGEEMLGLRLQEVHEVQFRNLIMCLTTTPEERKTVEIEQQR